VSKKVWKTVQTIVIQMILLRAFLRADLKGIPRVPHSNLVAQKANLMDHLRVIQMA